MDEDPKPKPGASDSLGWEIFSPNARRARKPKKIPRSRLATDSIVVSFESPVVCLPDLLNPCKKKGQPTHCEPGFTRKDRNPKA
ncbi:uncharacterized protein PG986_007765 [Apiospora aurea]|uniref:Uncharacterized protein n=1 Tax=Apiospora aurea TaxID=335848 RepID=A0ABR1QDT4_9PEZI